MSHRHTVLFLLLAALFTVGLRPMPDGALVPVLDVATLPAVGAPVEPFIALLETAPDAAEQNGIEAMQRGLTALRAGQHAQAKAAFHQAARDLPILEDWALLYVATAAAALGQADTVDAALARIDPWLAAERGWAIRVDALRRSGRSAQALLVALDASDRLTAPERRAAAAFDAALVQLALRDTAAAFGTLRRAMDLAPTSTFALDAARQLAALPRASADDHLAIGRLYARHGNATRALTSIDRYLASGRGTVAERGRAGVDAAKALFDARRYAEAERRLTSLTKERLPDSVAAEASLLFGRTQLRLNKTTAARATLLQVGEAHPNQRAAAEALYILADLDHDAGRIASARELYERAARALPASDASGDAALRLGGLLLAQGDAAGAARVYEAYHAAHTTGNRRIQAAFWTGRAKLDAGDSAAGRRFLQEVVDADPVSWYGLRAADLLGGAWTVSLGATAATGPEGQRLGEAALRRHDILSQLSLKDAVDLELVRLRTQLARRDGALYSVAEGLHERGQLLPAVLLGRDIRRDEGAWNRRLLRIVYPFPYRDEITTQAKRRGLDPFLVAGLIRQESLFNPTAKSVAGAIGLMQVRPPTGRELARKDGVNGFQNAHLQRPELNIRLGTLFFSDLLNRYDGRVSYVLAAYNAGPSRVARWRDLPEAVDPDLFAERIPFRETRDYVKVVQQNARIYQAIYAE